VKTVFIIDADLGFVFWLGQALQDSGYQVLPAKSFPEAATVITELKAEIDLLIVNPFLAGAAAFVDALRSSRPNLKVLAVLGENDPQVSQIPSPDATVRKPLQADRIASAVWVGMVEQLLLPDCAA
jgi:hypothetical protein